MSDEQARAHRRGDKVSIRWPDTTHWIPGRVIAGNPEQTRVAVSVPTLKAVNWGTRWLPIGTPVYADIPTVEVQLIATDPAWDAYSVKPFMTPEEYRFFDGNLKPRFQVDHSGRLGAYMPATDYQPEDPIWVWEDSWHKAVVVSTARSWINARLTEYRDRKGNTGKGFRPPFVWPAINDWPAPTTYIFADPTITLSEISPGFYARTSKRRL